VKDGKDLTRSIAGQDSGRYSLYATTRLTRKASSGSGGPGGGFGGRRRSGGGGFPGGGGGFPGGGGGFPEGGFPGGDDSGGGPPGGGGAGGGPQASFPEMSVSGDLWGVDAEKLLPNSKKDEKEMAFALTQQMLPWNYPALTEMNSRLAKQRLLPLASTLRLRTVGNGSRTDSSPFPDYTEAPTVVQMQVVSLDDKSAVSDDLFHLPDGYERIQPPAPALPFAGKMVAGGQRPGSAMPVTE